MSETTIQGKLPQPAVRVSSTDPFHITTPVARPQRPSKAGTEPGTGSGPGSGRRDAGGQPIRPDRTDIEIIKRPIIDHTTASSSSRQTKIIEPVARAGRQPQREAMAATLNQATPIRLTEAEGVLVNDLLRAHHDSLAEGAEHEAARELARSAASRSTN